MTTTFSTTFIDDIYDPVKDGFNLLEHFDKYPHHPWNKWRFLKRGDENHYTDSKEYTSKRFSLIWLNKNNYYYRIGAPAYLLLNNCNKIITEEWRVNSLVHRTDGPAIRSDFNKWFLCGCPMSKEEHKEIMELYNELGDWRLAFDLSSFEDYNETKLEENINRVMN